MPGESDSIRQQIREILLADWDPSNAARFEDSRHEYDSYIGPLLNLLRGGSSEQELVEFLHGRELECMCFPPAGSSHLRRVAQKLLAVCGRGDKSPG